jgi:hypothetical protein
MENAFAIKKGSSAGTFIINISDACNSRVYIPCEMRPLFAAHRMTGNEAIDCNWTKKVLIYLTAVSENYYNFERVTSCLVTAHAIGDDCYVLRITSAIGENRGVMCDKYRNDRRNVENLRDLWYCASSIITIIIVPLVDSGDYYDFQPSK